mmetsp:Transcript_24363/g.44709  ORF Transcript_24363/g.44709 Transcript_24363/m.44709 type:complete len:399 (+) Transcript_24363:2-1198(+)
MAQAYDSHIKSSTMALRPTSASFMKRLHAGVRLHVPSSRALVLHAPQTQVQPMQGAATAICRHTWRSLATDASASSSTAGAAADGEAQSKSKEDKETWTWTNFFMHLGGGIVGIGFLYYFRKSGYSIHGTELLLMERVRQMSLYPPPGPPEAETNSSLLADAIPREFVTAFAEWFIATDLRQGEGVTRDDVLDLCSELKFNEDDKACKAFINEGEGSFEEARRLSGCGLQEALSLLETLSVPADQRDKISGPAKGDLVRSRLGQQETEIVRRKCAGVQTVTSAASALQQAMLAPMPAEPSTNTSWFGSAPASPAPASSLPPFPPTPAASQATMPSSPASTEIESLDEADQDKLEIARLAREEQKLLVQLERRGSLSAAEEARLQRIQSELAATRARAG